VWCTISFILYPPHSSFQVCMPSKHRLVSVCCFFPLVVRDKWTSRCKCSDASGCGVGTGQMQHFFCSDRKINLNTTPPTLKKLHMIGIWNRDLQTQLEEYVYLLVHLLSSIREREKQRKARRRLGDVFKACSLLLCGLLLRHPLSHA